MSYPGAELQALINDALPRGGIQLPKGRTYETDRAIQVLDLEQERFEVDLNGSRILRTVRPATKAVALFHARWTSISLHNGHLEGKKAPAQGYQAKVEGHHGIILSACDDFALHDLTITHVPGDFIYLTGTGGSGLKQPPTYPCHTGWIERVQADDAGRHALTCIAAKDIHVESSSFTSYRRRRIDRERMSKYKSPPVIEGPNNVWSPYRRPRVSQERNNPR